MSYMKNHTKKGPGRRVCHKRSEAGMKIARRYNQVRYVARKPRPRAKREEPVMIGWLRNVAGELYERTRRAR